MGFLWKTTKVAIRVGLVAVAVKLSVDYDVWSLNTEKGEDLYSKLKKYIVPGTIVYREKLPSAEEVQTQVGSRWNGGVDRVFNVVENLPAQLNSSVNSIIHSK